MSTPTIEVAEIDTPGKPWLKTVYATYIPGAAYTWHWGDDWTTGDTGNIAQHIYHVGEGGSFDFTVRVEVTVGRAA